MAMIKLLEYTFDNTIDANCLPTFTGVGTTEVVDSVSGSITTRIINVEETGLPTQISFFQKTALLTLTYAKGDNVASTLNMFNGCTNLTSVDLSNYITSKVTTMQQMFSNCINLVELKGLDSLDTSNVTSMLNVFSGCRKIEKLDLINFNTSKVTNMRMTFANCNTLKELNIATWDTSNVTEMSSMFENCSSLTSLDLSHFHTENVKNIANVFLGCSSLKYLNLSGFKLNSSTSTINMFSNCKSLTTLDISNFNMSNVTNSSNMFYSATSLTNIGLLYSPSSTINTIASLLPTSVSTNIYYQDAIPSELTPVNNVNFIEYKSNTISTNDIVLRSLPNGVSDTLDLMTGEYVQRIGEIVLDGSEDEKYSQSDNSYYSDTILRFNITLSDIKMNTSNILCNRLIYRNIHNNAENRKYECICVQSNGSSVNILINSEKLETSDVNGFKLWLSQNPITVQYELETPIITTIDLKQHPFAYKDGYVVLTSSGEEISLTPTIEYSLIANRLGQIQSNQKLVEKQQAQIDELESMVIANLVNTQYQQALNEIKLGVK